MNENWGNDDWDDEPYEEDWDAYSSEEDDYIKCPNCHSEIYHDIAQCPDCGEFILEGTTSSDKKPVWIIAIAVILVILFLIQGFSF